MSTVASRRLDALLDAAEASGSCLVAHEERDRRALRRRLGMPNSDLLSPAPGLYVRRDHWLGLRPNERALHVMRGLAERRPGIVFCAQSAALAWGLPVSWHLLKETHVACQRKSGLHSTPQVVAHQISHDSPDVAGGLPVTSFWRTIFDCLASFPFADALAIADAALAKLYHSRKDMAALLRERFKGCPGVARATAICVWAEPAPESGGESIARANMICLGYAYPRLQLTLPDPQNRQRSFRIDFSWRGAGGRLIFGELDGDKKYTLAGREPLGALLDERKREALLTVYHASIARFSFAVARNPAKLAALLDLHGVPRGPAPELRDGVPVPPPGFADRPTIRGEGTMIMSDGMRIHFVEEYTCHAA